MVSSEEETRGRAVLQALRERVVRQERHGERPPALPLQGLRAQLHGDPGARQAAGDEGAGGAAPRPGQRQPGDDRQAARGEPRRRLQVGPGGRRGGARAFDHTGRQHRPDRRDVALRGREKNKVRVWRAYDPVARRTLAWELGGRDDATCRRLLDKVGIDGHVFVTDDWEGFRRLIPEEQHFAGKDLTFPIDPDNSDVGPHPARGGERRPPPPPPPLPPPPQGPLARPPHGRRRPQAALPPAAARELPAVARQLPICFWLSVSFLQSNMIDVASLSRWIKENTCRYNLLLEPVMDQALVHHLCSA